MTALVPQGVGEEQVLNRLFPLKATLDVQLRWAIRQRDLARRREVANGRRHRSMSALVRRLRRQAAIPDAPYYEYEDDFQGDE